MIIHMKKSLAILTFMVTLTPAGTAFATHTESNAASRTEPTAVADVAPRILELINRERAQAGLASLALDGEVTEIALRWSREMALAGRIGHNDAYFTSESMSRLNASTVGENVAFASSVDEIHSLLMESPPHRANILSPKYRLVGVGAVRTSTGDVYLTEDFLTRRADPPSRQERVAPARPAKSAPPARREKPPAPRRPGPKAGSPVVAKAPRTASAAPTPATKPPAPPPPSPPPAQTAPPTSPTPPATSPEAPSVDAPVEPAAVEPPLAPESPSESVPEPALEGAADRRPPTSSGGDLVKGLPALLLFRRRWFGRAL